MNILELPRVLIDFETRSELDVLDVGACAYAEHPSTSILFMSYSFNTQEACLTVPKLWKPFSDNPHDGISFPQEIIDHVLKGFVVEAHNAGFEKAIWRYILTRIHNIPYPEHWVDTMAVCAYRSIPMKLDDVGPAIGLATKKDKTGKDLIRKLCIPQKITKKNKNEWNNDPILMEQLGDYCIQDNSTEHNLSEVIGDLPLAEYNLWLLDQKINERGVCIDIEAVVKAKHIVEKVSTDLQKEITELTDGVVTTGGQTARIKKWCNARGASLASMTKDAVEYELTTDLQPEVRRLLELRQWLGRSSTKKLDKFFNCISSGQRIRGMLCYHGAGTGRWAGRMVQPQNLPRGTIKDMDMLIDVIKTGRSDLLELHYGNPMEAVASSLRGMLIADKGKQLYVSDFSNIEARVTMWCAGEEEALEAFEKNDRKEGPDIYCVMAESIYGYPIDKDEHPDERGLGKVTILGCGYQMGGPRLKVQAEQQFGIKVTEDRAIFLVNTFRETYPLVKEFWYGVQGAAIDALMLDKPVSYKCVTYETVYDAAGKWLTCKLPSGRLLWYYDPILKDVETAWGWNKQVTYMGRNNKAGGHWSRIYTYGGMLTENIVQAISRDIMVESMYKVEAADYPIILTAHDEVVAEVDEGFGSVKEFDDLMAVTPSWAIGCPVACEGWAGVRYRKG
jgi:DNA polymerase